jgi:hypothetical protein
MKRHLSTLLKIAVTIIGLILVFRQIDGEALKQTLLQADLAWVGVAFLLVSLSLVWRAYRWLMLLRGLGSQVPFRRLIKLYYVGSFFNAFLPSGFGGDVVRVVEVNRELDLNVATGTVVLDRLTGLTTQFILALFLLPFRAATIPPLLIGLIIVGATGSIAGLSLLAEHDLLCRWGSWLPGPLSPVGDGLAARVLKAMHACGWQAIVKAMGVSFLFNFLLVSWWASLGQALQLSVPFTHYLFAVPVLSVLLLVPSIGGLGVRELVAPTLFAGAISEVEAVSLSLMVFGVVRTAGLLGAPLYLWDTLHRYMTKSAPES